jgi:hypothetical protein
MASDDGATRRAPRLERPPAAAPGRATGRPPPARPARERRPAPAPAPAWARGRGGVSLDVAGVLALQRAAGNAAVAALVSDRPSPVLDMLAQAGRPLPSGLRADMEANLGHDFGDVRIHTDGRAAVAAQSIEARAFTSGRHIGFATGEYAPATNSGRRMLAHELTHVVQQRAGPVAATPAGGGIALSHPSDRFERAAEAAAAAATSRRPA